MDKKEYLKHYRNDPANREKHNTRNREAYATEEGGKKEAKRRRTPEVRYAKCRHDASRRKSGAKEFTISLEEYRVLVSQPCTYCLKSMENETGSGLDRKTHTIGYIWSNLVSCCGSCNRIKGRSMDYESFLAQSILNRRREKLD